MPPMELLIHPVDHRKVYTNLVINQIILSFSTNKKIIEITVMEKYDTAKCEIIALCVITALCWSS